MKILDFFKPKKEIQVNTEIQYWSGANIMPVIFDGEKTPYELGTPRDYYLDYQSLRARAWQAYIESPIVQNVLKKYSLWVVGSGLKLQANPIDLITGLSEQEIKAYSQKVEAHFRLYSSMKQSSYSSMMSLHELAAEAFKNALMSGDVLNIMRFDGQNVTHEIIDGCFISTPLEKTQLAPGNKIIDGVEIDKTGKHIAFYVQNESYKWERIPAYGEKTGRLQAWLFYGMRYKINSVRGMSILTAVLEMDNKLNRYQDATLGSAEENAKVPYTIEHNQFSDGENPLVKQLVQSAGKNKGTAPETQSTIESENIATKVAQTTSKQVYNMPIGSELKRNTFATDLSFKDYFGVNIDLIYITVGIPPEVAADKFGGAYSGSRAALKSWEYKLMVDRNLYLKNQFYKPNFDYWLDIQVLTNKIDVPAYLEALLNNDIFKLESFRNCRFIGATVPHIDPVKEVNAERLKLGKKFDLVPLTTAEQSCEALNTGDFDQNIKKSQDEKEMASYFDEIINEIPQ
jgi:capsid protein